MEERIGATEHQRSGEGVQRRASRLRWLRIAFGVLCGAVFMLLFVRSVDLRATLSIIGDLSWWPVLIGLGAYLLDFILRAIRFWMLLGVDERKKVPLQSTVAPFVASFGISDILPLRLGDVFRVYWFNRAFDLPVSKLLAAMILERVFDLVSILALAAIAMWVIGATLQEPVLATLRIVLGVAAAAGLSVVFAPRLLRLASGWLAHWRSSFWQQLAAFLQSVADAIGQFRSVRRVCGYFAFSLVIWLLESAVVLGAWIGLGGSGGELVKPFFAFAISTLGTLVPALPGHFGTYEYFGVLAFDAVGVERNFAAAVILTAHLVLWLPTALFAIGWLMLHGQARTQAFATRR
ncbi:lysylphosphatidylglycerol synthase transmembrane domain-containing protein [Qipengyuania sp. XHP0207]|uniref:lysylphosphatidylglycerol synthase transmembrane domain-containing protein n=1 Tax=Qipengyuania sp. XHP0207 TaxID=3038078 RepID=UPI0024202BFF|nr:lysylphosphatidylglycerol synthase transmembrane domain-containing protein [Qipengyuania sp. XHP0207]MDG5747613.1 lysylphosphatidylglycerol synthase transmembrane domain-containing protein [Qipengyuania sp. XHP0207]